MRQLKLVKVQFRGPELNIKKRHYFKNDYPCLVSLDFRQPTEDAILMDGRASCVISVLPIKLFDMTTITFIAKHTITFIAKERDIRLYDLTMAVLSCIATHD